MADIFINIQKLEEADQGLQRILLELNEVENSIALIRRGLSEDIKQRCGINKQMSSLYKEVCTMRRQVNRLRQISKTGVNSYRTVEYRLSHSVPREK